MNSKSRITHHASRLTFDVYLVGVGGQGVLTIGDLITETAARQGMPVSFYPTKGMAQRGGAVKARLRLGREGGGPNIPEQGADLVIAMERSEALKAIRFIKPGGDFLLFDHVWAPTAVMLGKADYPTLEQAIEKIQEAGHRSETSPNNLSRSPRVSDRGEPGHWSETSPNAGGRMRYLAPKDLPLYEGAPVAANVYVLGAALGHTSLGEILDQVEVANLVQARWKRGAERNRLAFQAGLEVSYGEY